MLHCKNHFWISAHWICVIAVCCTLVYFNHQCSKKDNITLVEQYVYKWMKCCDKRYILGVIVDIAKIRTSSLSLPYFDEHQPFETLHIVTQRHILWRLSRPRNRLIHIFERPINHTRYKIMLENGSFLKLCFMSWREGFPTERREETSNCCWLQHARDKRAPTKVQIFSFSRCAHSDFCVREDLN